MRILTRIVAVLLFLSLVTGKEASALVVLQDYEYPEYSFELQPEPGYSYWFRFSYAVDTDFVEPAVPELDAPDSEGWVNHDLFFYGVMNQDWEILWGLNPVDITGSVGWTDFEQLITPGAADLNLIAYLTVADVNLDYYATVSIDNVRLEKVDAAPVPEPSSLLLFAAGLAGVYAYRRRK